MKKLTLIALFLFVGLASNSWATTYTGSLAWTDGAWSAITATNPWDKTSTKITYWVTDPLQFGGAGTYLWEYVYTFEAYSPDGGGISHMIIEVSSTFMEANFFDGTTPYELETHKAGGGNPNMPYDMYGIKWNMDDIPDENTGTYDGTNIGWVTVTVVTDRSPMWGDFYAKGGFPYAYNTAFTSGGPSENFDFVNYKDDQILVPDSETGVIPEPGTFLLLGTGLLGIAAIRYRRSKK